MDEALVQAVTDRIWAAWGDGRPPALLLGRAPEEDLGYRYVQEPPYEAVVLGLLPPGLLLQMPTEPVCRALLSGMPVYLWANQPYRRWPHGKLLQRELREAQARLIRLGAREWRGETV